MFKRNHASPYLTPSIIARFTLLAFTYSLDDFAVTFFADKEMAFQPQSVEIYSRARKEISAEDRNTLSCPRLFSLVWLVVWMCYLEMRRREQA